MKKYQRFKVMASDGMKQIKGGNGDPASTLTKCGDSSDSCSYYEAGNGKVTGTCETNSNFRCVCKSRNSSVISQTCGDPQGA